jgi:hypothetical protein
MCNYCVAIVINRREALLLFQVSLGVSHDDTNAVVDSRYETEGMTLRWERSGVLLLSLDPLLSPTMGGYVDMTPNCMSIVCHSAAERDRWFAVLQVCCHHACSAAPVAAFDHH